jgi:hypothetical protein
MLQRDIGDRKNFGGASSLSLRAVLALSSQPRGNGTDGCFVEFLGAFENRSSPSNSAAPGNAGPTLQESVVASAAWQSQCGSPR